MAGTLSGGEQQMLAIGRALVARPRLLLLDEPSLGLAPKFITRIFLTLRELKKEGKTILLVEQNARQALQVADRGYVMERGRIVLSGSGQELAEHARGPAHLSRATCGMTTASTTEVQWSGFAANMIAISEIHVAQTQRD